MPKTTIFNIKTIYCSIECASSIFFRFSKLRPYEKSATHHFDICIFLSRKNCYGTETEGQISYSTLGKEDAQLFNHFHQNLIALYIGIILLVAMNCIIII
jgi:hypothetical protein